MKKLCVGMFVLTLFFTLSKMSLASDLYAVIAVPEKTALSEVKKVNYAENVELTQSRQVTALFSLFDSNRGFLKMPFDDDNEGFFANILNRIREFLSNLFPGLSNEDDDESDFEDEFEDIGGEIEGFGEDVGDELDDLFTVAKNDDLPASLLKVINTYKQSGYSTIIFRVNK